MTVIISLIFANDLKMFDTLTALIYLIGLLAHSPLLTIFQVLLVQAMSDWLGWDSSLL